MARRVRPCLAHAALVLSLATAGCAAPRDQRSEAPSAGSLVHDASVAMETIVDDGDRPALRTALHGACAALVFPHLRGGAFFAGWSSGDGVLMARDPATARWLGPAFFSLGDATIGPEVAMSRWQLIVVFQRCDALRPLQEGKGSFSFSTSFARQSAEDDAGLLVKPEVRAFVRTEGIVVGISLHFAEVRANGALSATCYGRTMTSAQALAPGIEGNDDVAALRRAMERATR